MRVLDGRYRLEDRVGRGGMSEVYAATDVRLGRAVAVKVLAADVEDPRARARFEREALSLSSFVHPNAVAIFDAGVDGEQPYLVMELIDGPSLSEYLHRRGRLPARQAVTIAEQLLAALDAAHRRGIVHRDVKPSNILLGGDGRVRLADFGIAKSFNELTRDLTLTGHIVGTASYLAPEVARGEPATPASDVYAVGLVLFEMLTGDVPLRGDTPLATLTARDCEPPPHVRSIRPDVSPALDAAIATALQRDPSRRFASAGAMRDAITDGRDDTATIRQPAPAAPTAPFAAPTVPTAAPHASATAPRTSTTAPLAAPPRRRRRRWVTRVLVPLVLVAIVGGVVLALATSTDDPSSPGAARATQATDRPATTVPETTAPTTTTTTTVPRPVSLAALAAALATGDNRYGAQQQTLRAQLLALLGSNRGQQARDAFAITREVTRWAATGQLDPMIAADAVRLLGAVQQQPQLQPQPVQPGKHDNRGGPGAQGNQAD